MNFVLTFIVAHPSAEVAVCLAVFYAGIVLIFSRMVTSCYLSAGKGALDVLITAVVESTCLASKAVKSPRPPGLSPALVT